MAHNEHTTSGPGWEHGQWAPVPVALIRAIVEAPTPQRRVWAVAYLVMWCLTFDGIRRGRRFSQRELAEYAGANKARAKQAMIHAQEWHGHWASWTLFRQNRSSGWTNVGHALSVATDNNAGKLDSGWTKVGHSLDDRARGSTNYNHNHTTSEHTTSENHDRSGEVAADVGSGVGGDLISEGAHALRPAIGGPLWDAGLKTWQELSECTRFELIEVYQSCGRKITNISGKLDLIERRLGKMGLRLRLTGAQAEPTHQGEAERVWERVDQALLRFGGRPPHTGRDPWWFSDDATQDGLIIQAIIQATEPITGAGDVGSAWAYLYNHTGNESKARKIRRSFIAAYRKGKKASA